MATLSSGTTSQSYYLRFSSHSAALSRSLLGLLSESYCTDVHISTGHQSQTIRAHKIILSAFSPYFKSLFSSLPSNQFPVIIIREIGYDILRTIIEFCYRGEILVSRDKLDDIVSAAKFLQIEGAKDFILPKQHQSQQPGQQHHHNNNNTSTTGAVNNANNKMQIDLQHMKSANINQKQTLLAQQQQQQHKQMSLLSKLVQKAPVAQANSAGQQSAADTPLPNLVRHISDNELLSEKSVKQELIDEEVVEEEEEEVYEGLEGSDTSGVGADGCHKSGDKSEMFSDFEYQTSLANNKSNNESNRNSEDSCLDEEPMDTSAAAMLARVPPGTSVSTTGHSTDTNSGQQFKSSDNMNVPTNDSEEELVLEEEEEYEDEFDEEEEEDHLDSANPLGLCSVNMSESDGQQSVDRALHMSSATARAIAASTLASFNTNIDIESESQSSQYSSPQSVTFGERRGRGRPPKYEMGGLFSGQQPTTSSTVPAITITAQAAQPSSTSSTSQSTAIGAQQLDASTSSQASSRTRRGRPPSMPEELLRSLTGRLDKAHHKCPHCPQIYYGYHAMRDHITSVHLNSGEKYICNLCNKEYTWRITLRKHLKFHHGVHPDQVQNA